MQLARFGLLWLQVWTHRVLLQGAHPSDQWHSAALGSHWQYTNARQVTPGTRSFLYATVDLLTLTHTHEILAYLAKKKKEITMYNRKQLMCPDAPRGARGQPYVMPI